MNDHESYMRRAIELAANVPDFPSGALIVDRNSGKILSEGWNKSSINPTFHGEIDAINQLALLAHRRDGDAVPQNDIL
jgi:tRNA(Arg) A34 adenosine deaminase TadA